MNPYILIMAGGVGSRFWPASREHLPKQFLDITGTGKSLIRLTVDRFKAFVPVENIYIITHFDYGDLVRQFIPELSNAQVIEEPSRNNTAASIALASMKLSKINPEAICVVAPADHVISDEKEFERVIQLAYSHAEKQSSIITLGIEPTRPDTGYGYIEFDKTEQAEIYPVKSFREKPDQASAEQYLETGSFVWNAGIFVWRINVILEKFRDHAPQIYNLLFPGMKVYNMPEEVSFIGEHYPKTEKTSVDYAILERADNVYTIPCQIGWSDIGTWNSLYAFCEKDESNNVVQTNTAHLEQAKDNLVVVPKDKLVVLKGLEDYIVIDTEDCLLIYPKAEEQEIKVLKETLKEQGYKDFL